MGNHATHSTVTVEKGKEYEIEYNNNDQEWLPVETSTNASTERGDRLRSSSRSASSQDFDVLRQRCHSVPFFGTCCQNEDILEEVVVVHHEALRKVDFLLRYDELARCESPSIPACVSALKHRRLRAGKLENKALVEIEERAFQESANLGSINTNINDPEYQGDDMSVLTDDIDVGSNDGYNTKYENMEPSQLINHIVAERRKLQYFLQKMAVEGIPIKTLDVIPKSSSQNSARLGRGILVSATLSIEETDDLHLGFHIEGRAPRIIPFPSIGGVFFGRPDEAVEGEDPLMCCLIAQRLPIEIKSQNPPKTMSNMLFQNNESSHHILFLTIADRDFFNHGIRRMRDHNQVLKYGYVR